MFGFRVDWNVLIVHPSSFLQVEVLSKEKRLCVCVYARGGGSPYWCTLQKWMESSSSPP